MPNAFLNLPIETRTEAEYVKQEPIVLQRGHHEFANQVIYQFAARDIVLSDHAKSLLRLAVDGWLDDSPPEIFNQRVRQQMGGSGDHQQLVLKQLAEEIIIKTLNDPHIKNRKGKVRFTALLGALSDIGKKFFSGAFGKGFTRYARR